LRPGRCSFGIGSSLRSRTSAVRCAPCARWIPMEPATDP
jgi:hypothetical protein